MDITSRGFAAQSSLSGDFSGNSNTTHRITTNNYSLQVPSYIPSTFEELIARNGWGVSPPEIDLYHLRDEYNLLEADTGEWVFGSVEYRKWRESSQSKILWLCGGPGTGKTMLAKSIVAELLTGPDSRRGEVKLLSHFVSPELPTEETSIDNSQTQRLRLAKVASDLLYGILQQDGGLFDGCKVELETQGNRFFTNPSSLWRVLRRAIKKCHTDPVCILIDGIDGLQATLCGELITRILGLADIPEVKIFFSSRIVPAVSAKLSQYMKINLDGNDFVKADVKTFIEHRVNALAGWNEDLIRETLLAKAEGNFLWASLVIDNFDTSLGESPPELEGVYQGMLRRILESDGFVEVLNIIWYVALAVRPLRFSELGHILVRMEGKARSKQGSSHGRASIERQPTEGEIESSIMSCQGFLRSAAGTVSIVHHTAIEYLFDEERDDGLPKCSKSGLDFILSWECFQYLHAAFDDPREDRERDFKEDPGETGSELAWEDAREAADTHKYLRYAAESWFVHARRSIEISMDKFYDEDHNWFQHQFFDTGDTIRKPWIELCGDPRMEVLAGEQTPLHIAVCLGLLPLVEEALLRFNEGTNNTQSPLHLAAKFMSGAYKILIAKGRRWLLTNPDQDGNTPLHQAVIFGHSSMLVGLVERFTEDSLHSKEINMKNNYGNTPLHLAVQFDHPDIFKFLAKNGADITIPNNAGLTPAALRGILGRGDTLQILRQGDGVGEVAKGIVEEPVERPVGRLYDFQTLPGHHLQGLLQADPPGNKTAISEESNPMAVQSFISRICSGTYLSNNVYGNTITNYSIRVASKVPATFEELIANNGWRVSPPEIDLVHLRNEENLPEAGTGEWIFQDDRYKRWRESRGPRLLWLCGGLGTGKTTLAKGVAAELLKGTDSGGDKLFFNFLSPVPLTTGTPADDTELSQRGLAKVASDLLYGILQQDGNLFDGCRAELEEWGNVFFTTPLSLWKVLRDAILACGAVPVYVLIDGLDGLKGRLRGELIRRIWGLMEVPTVKIFLSTRNAPYIANNIAGDPSGYTKINLDANSFVKEDVGAFIRRRVDATRWDRDQKERAIETILENPDVTFLEALLAIENLTCLRPRPDFEMFLGKLPLGLEAVYREMLRTLLLRGEAEELLKMIRLAVSSLRPLTFRELGYILTCMGERATAERSSNGGISQGTRPKSEEEIRSYVQSSQGFLRATATTVSIVHHTAVEYLCGEKADGAPPVLSQSDLDLTLSWECFRYLHHAFGDPGWPSSGDFMGHHNRSLGSGVEGGHQRAELGVTLWRVAQKDPWEVARKDPWEAMAEWPFLRYAAESWFIHARRSIQIAKNQFSDNSAHNWLQYQFFATSDAIRKPWIQLCGDPEMELLAGEQTPLHIAVRLGILPLVERALSDFTAGADGGQSPLHLAAKFVSGEYKGLIAEGGPSLLTVPDRDGNTPLHEATISGHRHMVVALVERLTENRAHTKEINKTNHYGNTPLHLAFQFDHPKIVRFLIKNGADPNIRNNSQVTARQLGERLKRADCLGILKNTMMTPGKSIEETKSAEGIKEPAWEPMKKPMQDPTREPRMAPPARKPHKGQGDPTVVQSDLAIQGDSSGNFWANNGSHNIYRSTTLNINGILVPKDVPATFEELIARNGWGVSPPEIDLYHLRDECNLPEADTGKWIFESVEYKKWWEDSQSKLLWLCGGPGTGKTMLAKSIVAELLTGPDSRRGEVKLLSHFASPELPTGKIPIDDPQAQKPGLAKVASDLLYSILQQDESLFGGCKAELERQGDRFFTNQSSLWKVLRKAIQKCRADPVCILIDGIDGLEPTLCKDLIERILGLANIPKVKIFFSSRIVPVVSNNLSQHMQINLDGNDLVKGDVKIFIKQKVDRLKWGKGQKERVRETLLAKAEGTFLWASLVIENLARYCSEPDFDTFLEESPPELEGVYQKMLRQIKERRGSKKVLDMMRCVAIAVRPLTFDELSHSPVYMEGKAKSKQRSSHGGASTSQPTEKEIEKSVRSCQGFLRSVAGTVSMVHHTAVEYLFYEWRDDSPPSFSGPSPDFVIAWECFQYLHAAFDDSGEARKGDVRGHNDEPSGSGSKREHQEVESGETGWELARERAQEAAAKKKFLRYAAESWFVHARRSVGISKAGDKFYDEGTHNWFQYPFFETGDTIRKVWIVLCGDPRMEVLVGEQTPLHIAVCLGLTPLVEEALLRFEEGANGMQSPLHFAAKFMSGAYKILIAKGGRWILTNPDEDGNTPLHQAAIFGHSSMVGGLVEKFIENTAYSKEINRQNNYGNTTLHLAVQFDYPDMVEFLAKNGADMIIPNNSGFTATKLGEALGREDSLDILKRFQEIQQQEPAGGGPLEEGVEKYVKRLAGEIVGEPAGEPWKKHRRQHGKQPVMPAGELEGEPERSWWRAQGKRLGRWPRRMWGDIWGGPRGKLGSAEERHEMEGGRRNWS